MSQPIPQYFDFLKDGKVSGPVPAVFLYHACKRGDLSWDTQVRAESGTEWIPFSSLPDSWYTDSSENHAGEIAREKMSRSTPTRLNPRDGQSPVRHPSHGSRFKWKNRHTFVTVFLVAVVVAITHPNEGFDVEILAQTEARDNLKNPDSFNNASTQTFELANGIKAVNVHYTATNSFGGTVPGDQTFYFDSAKNFVDENGRIIKRYLK